MDSNPYEDIVGRYFSCQDDPPLELVDCPAGSRVAGYNGPIFNTDTGAWSCPICYAVVGRDNEEGDELFDEDEEEAFDNDEDYIAEGDRIQDQTEEESIRVTRYRAIEEIVETLGTINPTFARYLVNNQYNIVEHLRILEESQELLFEARPGVPVKPKILALAVHFSSTPLPSAQLRLLGIRQAAIDSRLKVLRSLSNNDSDASPIVENIYYVGKAIGLSKPILDIIVEQYEEVGILPNKEPDETTRAAAWIYLSSKQSKIKGVTKTKLKKVPRVKKNALDRAIDSYRVNLQNRIKPVEGVLLTDDN